MTGQNGCTIWLPDDSNPRRFTGGLIVGVGVQFVVDGDQIALAMPAQPSPMTLLPAAERGERHTLILFGRLMYYGVQLVAFLPPDVAIVTYADAWHVLHGQALGVGVHRLNAPGAGVFVPAFGPPTTAYALAEQVAGAVKLGRLIEPSRRWGGEVIQAKSGLAAGRGN